MGTKIFSNKRQPQTFQPIEKKTKPEPPPPEPDPPKKDPRQATPGTRLCACGCGGETAYTYKRGHHHRVKQAKALKGRIRSAKKDESGGKITPYRKPRGDGFGLWICGNCKWFEGSRQGDKPCSSGKRTKYNSLPCDRNTHGFGYFEPIEVTKRIADLDLSEFDAGELMMLTWRARKHMHLIQLGKINKFKLGQRVKFYLNKELRRGSVIKLATRHVIVETEDACVITLKPREVEPDEEPLTAGLQSFEGSR